MLLPTTITQTERRFENEQKSVSQNGWNWVRFFGGRSNPGDIRFGG
jgi:hypothetical protein